MYGIKDFVPPVVGNYRITSVEGPRQSRRTTNGARMSSFHHGSDWAGETPGSKPPVRAITSGEVIYAGKAGGYGNVVMIRNPDGYVVQAAHLDSIGVKVGDKVPAGKAIGIMGMTGNSTGVHLDLTVVKDGKTITRDGRELAAAPASVMRRAGGKAPPKQALAAAPTPSVAPVPDTPTAPVREPKPTQVAQVPTGDMFSGTPTTLLQGGVGLAVPDTATQNQLFSQVSDMGLDKEMESIYAEAARAIADAKDSVASRPMLQSVNPLRAELNSIFDTIEV